MRVAAPARRDDPGRHGDDTADDTLDEGRSTWVVAVAIAGLIAIVIAGAVVVLRSRRA